MKTPGNLLNALVQSSEQVADIPTDFHREIKEIEAESIGWIPLDYTAYLHVGSDEDTVEIVGLAGAWMADSNVLWIV